MTYYMLSTVSGDSWRQRPEAQFSFNHVVFAADDEAEARVFAEDYFGSDFWSDPTLTTCTETADPDAPTH